VKSELGGLTSLYPLSPSSPTTCETSHLPHLQQRRSLLRLTAKSGQFNRGTFTSWLIANAGTLPIQRPKDFEGKKVDNAIVFEKLIHSLERGDMVCMFPEGLSRYWPEMTPLRQGVARIIGDTLKRKKDVKGFQIAVQTCSITCESLSLPSSAAPS
jgi:glycerol-3-phosphate O-acyltransferase / dihydroxyacetone phosphate acyltransferase